jgi:phospholipid/cholesterol/gamma-HCH transport system ATP-binding protein
MIEFTNVSVGGFKQNLSLRIEDGRVCKIVIGSRYEQRMLLDVMLGFNRPESGSIIIGQTDVYAGDPMRDAHRRAAVAWSDGGLISNLSVWENLTLPLWYHIGDARRGAAANPDNPVEKIAGIFQAMDMDAWEFFEKHFDRLPGFLPPHLKTLFGIVRAMLMEPEVIIYDSAFESFSPAMAAKIVQAARAFHSERRERVSLYLTTDANSAKELSPDIVVELKEKGFSTI